MSKLFDLDSPLIRWLNKVADLMWLNMLTLFCCIPIITAGAALTSAHYVALKMLRNEEGYVTREFFKAFKTNFKQSTLIWLLILLVVAVLGADYYIIKYTKIDFPQVFQVIIMAAGILFLFMVLWVFPVQAKFINTLPKTIKNAFALSIIQMPRTLLMIIVYVLPYVLLFLSLRIFPLVFVFGISVPVYVSAVLYNKMFKKLEGKIRERLEEENEGKEDSEPADGETDEDSGKIFSDKPMLGEEKQP
ncbi:MAG: DUF624 domain-containing protein [Lachnospiraceae bacterium]|nr:DUF624 domain-containing protein [Lachnospiraceae bacterium]